jgi:hypothetical protein
MFFFVFFSETTKTVVSGMWSEPMIPGMGMDEDTKRQEEAKEEGNLEFGLEKEEDSILAIPGLDIQGGEGGDEDKAKKKVPFAKPIPKVFMKCWNDLKVVLPMNDMGGGEKAVGGVYLKR